MLLFVRNAELSGYLPLRPVCRGPFEHFVRVLALLTLTLGAPRALVGPTGLRSYWRYGSSAVEDGGALERPYLALWWAPRARRPLGVQLWPCATQWRAQNARASRCNPATARIRRDRFCVALRAAQLANVWIG